MRCFSSAHARVTNCYFVTLDDRSNSQKLSIQRQSEIVPETRLTIRPLQLKAGPQKDDDFIAIVEAHSLLGEKDQAFAWLEKAYSEHARGMMHLKENVLLDNLGADPRYAELMRRVRLPE